MTLGMKLRNGSRAWPFFSRAFRLSGDLRKVLQKLIRKNISNCCFARGSTPTNIFVGVDPLAKQQFEMFFRISFCKTFRKSPDSRKALLKNGHALEPFLNFIPKVITGQDANKIL